MTIYNVNT